MSGAVRGLKHDPSKGEPGRTAYRAGCHCPACKEDAAAAKREQRARRKREEREQQARPKLTLVPAIAPELEQEEPAADVDEQTVEEPAGVEYHDVPAWGAVEKAVHTDIDALPATTPFIAVLKATALALAREIDDVNAKGSKATAARQLTDIVRELKEKGPEGAGSSIESLLGAPEVPSGDAAVPYPDAP